MLRRIKIENFRCLENVEFRPQPLQLLLGLNGSGKSSFFDALTRLRQMIVLGYPAREAFGPNTLTRWSDRRLQTFEVDVEGNGGIYKYLLHLTHSEVGQDVAVAEEHLAFNGVMIARAVNGALLEVRVDKSQTLNPDWKIPFGGEKSLFTIIGRHVQSPSFRWFRDWIAGLYCVHLSPTQMLSSADRGAEHPSPDFSNFAAWYMHILLETPSKALDVEKDLRDIFPGFKALAHRQVGQNAREMKAVFENPKASLQTEEYGLSELSDGQRALIVLYTLLRCAMPKDSTICLDEPENFLALPEIQPWLSLVSDRVADEGCQVILASHHPEILNQLAPSNGTVFCRDESGGVLLKPYQATSGMPITPAEEIARGWDRE